MNRELKFRIWDKEAKRWLCEDSQYLVMDGSEVLPAPWSTLGFKTANENFVIQQYTGIKDKNNKEIYEGDILNLIREVNSERGEFKNYTENFIGQIEYLGSSFIFNENSLDEIICDIAFESPFIKKFEIIGNIFENSELLKKNEN